MSERRDDRRVKRTRRQLRDALVSLILEKGWDAVSVQDVCAKADVGRSTFYVHFADKEDLLLSGFDDLHAALAAPRTGTAPPFAFAEAMLAHVAENQDLGRAMMGRQSSLQIQWRIRDVVRNLVDAELGSLPKAARRGPVSFIAGGFCELLWAWIDGPSTVTADEVAAAFRRFAAAIVRLAHASA